MTRSLHEVTGDLATAIAEARAALERGHHYLTGSTDSNSGKTIFSDALARICAVAPDIWRLTLAAQLLDAALESLELFDAIDEGENVSLRSQIDAIKAVTSREQA